ncbi:MAG: hypothetical protein HGB10_06760 [Coriobacteriia bacterium]|nr:hypothetical protein [Coriobacteriia bacterium]
MRSTLSGPSAFARLLMIAIVFCMLALGTAAQAFATDYDPELVISNANLRDYDSMTVAEIQAFLESQDGILKSYSTRDYDKVITLSKTVSNVNTTPDKGEPLKPASQIIWEACQAWKINPKVMLTMLQKEQSLITTKPQPGSTTLARAIGAGCPGSLVQDYPPYNNKVATNRYPGFGNQMWHGARLLDGYGEGKNGSTIPLFTAGIKNWVYAPTVSGSTWVLVGKRNYSAARELYDYYDYEYRAPNATILRTRKWSTTDKAYHATYYIRTSNLATYKLYTYNPSIGTRMPYNDLVGRGCTGNANFWKLYRGYFGSTLTGPQFKRVFRFRNRSNGTYLYTASLTERYHLASSHSGTWLYQGTSFSVDTSVAAASTIPVYRFYNKDTHRYSFTNDTAVYDYRRSTAGKRIWTYQGIAFRAASKASAGSVAIYRFFNKQTRTTLFTSKKSAITELRKTAALRRIWSYEGVAFHLPRAGTL